MRKFVLKDGRIHGKVEDLIDEPVVLTVHYFDEKGVAKFSEQMSRAHETGQPVVPVVIDSYGGEVYALLAMITAIQNSRLPVATVIEGKAMSCGSVLFAFGSPGHRYISPHGTLMIHSVAHSCDGKVEETRASVDQAELLNEKVFRMMAKNCGHPPNYFLNLIHAKKHADWYLDAREAKKHNIADQLRIPELKTTLHVDIALT